MSEPETVSGHVLWIDAVGAGPFGDASTLVQIGVGQRTFFVKLSGEESLPVGSDVSLVNLPAWGKLFEASLTRAQRGTLLITVAQPLM